ncbi:MAG TPA: polymer-forming cytoskeletal protein [Thermoanaerobaculia bacterium]|nr:polymer-forming cytoskeletal protein [Thermoanaerobaculia bacterium]
MSSRLTRAAIPLLTLTALFLSGLLILPAGARGEEKRVPAGSRQTDDIFSFRDDVEVSGVVFGSVQVLAASARISGRVAGDLVVFGGDVELGPDARIDGDVVCVGGTIRGLGDATIGGDVFAPGRAAGGFRIAGSRTARALEAKPFSLIDVALKLSLLLIWLCAAIIVTLVSGREVRASSVELRASPFHTFVLGLVAFTSFVLTAIVFTYLIPYLIGIPLIIALLIFALMAKIYGMIALFHAVGTLVARPRSRDELGRRRWLRGDMALVVVGLLIMGLLRMIPVVGNIIWIGASLFGIGVAVGTKFGRREPWFLAWQPAA